MPTPAPFLLHVAQSARLLLRFFAVAVIVGLCVTTAEAAALKLVAPDSVRSLILKHVSAFDARRADTAEDDEAEQISDEADTLARIRRARKEIPGLLETEGYFSPHIEVEQMSGGRAVVHVSTGRRTTVREVEIRFKGELGADTEERRVRREALIDAWALPKDQPFTQAGWATAKGKLLTDVSSRDFAAAKIAESAVDVDPERAVARLLVVVDSGPAFRLGAIDLQGLSLYDRDLVERYNVLREGEPFDYERLVALQNALQSTPYFSGAIVEIDRDPALADATPVRIAITEAEPRRFGVGVGFSSNTGARSELNYRDANLFGRALELNSSLRVEEKRQSAFADVFLPQTHSGFRDAAGITWLSEDIQNLVTQRFSVGVQRMRTLQRTTVRVSLNYQREITRPEGAEEQVSTALTLNYGADVRSVDNPADPRRGFSAGFQIGGGARSVLSDQNFLRLYGRAQYFRPIAESGTLILRGEGGYTIAPSRQGIPQDFLFRTGGSQSVRGYDYQSLGVAEGAAVVGGRALMVLSSEYVYWVSGPWGVATFVDAGDAKDTWQDMRLKLGYGIGGRWRSPAGPLGMDVAYGQEDKKFRLHFTLAVAF